MSSSVQQIPAAASRDQKVENIYESSRGLVMSANGDYANAVDGQAELNFLVADGGILAKAVVRYVLPGVGVGLQFKNVRTEDQPQFEAMLKRVIHLV